MVCPLGTYIEGFVRGGGEGGIDVDLLLLLKVLTLLGKAMRLKG